MTNAGKAIITGLVSQVTSLVPKYVAWGTGAGTAVAADTVLFTEDSTVGYARTSGTVSRVTTSQTNDTFQVVGTLTAGASLTITNAGLFDAVTTGNLFVKGDFTGIALTTADSIQFTFKVQFT